MRSACGVLVKLSKKLQETCVAVKGTTGYVGHPGYVLSGMITFVEQEGKNLNSFHVLE